MLFSSFHETNVLLYLVDNPTVVYGVVKYGSHAFRSLKRLKAGYVMAANNKGMRF